jgi:hypothetical protein
MSRLRTRSPSGAGPRRRWRRGRWWQHRRSARPRFQKPVRIAAIRRHAFRTRQKSLDTLRTSVIRSLQPLAPGDAPQILHCGRPGRWYNCATSDSWAVVGRWAARCGRRPRVLSKLVPRPEDQAIMWGSARGHFRRPVLSRGNSATTCSVEVCSPADESQTPRAC